MCVCVVVWWGRGGGHSLADVPVSEQELAAEVALLDDVIISHRQLALLPGAHTHARQILDQLAAQRARAHHEHIQIQELPL